MVQIKVTEANNSSDNIYIDKDANICPYCHKSITAERQHGYKANRRVELVYRCPDNECRSIFVGYFELRDGKVYLFRKTSIGTAKAREFSENVENISPLFIEIYNQAIVAEGYGLNHVTGIGLRKALEFLIKDYLVIKKPSKKEEILNKMIAQCIKDHLDNPNIKDMAERAVWIGNDHTHYIKKWEDKDVTDLKVLIDVTLHWIEMELLTDKYKSEMAK